MEEFEYNSMNSYEENFETWHYLNTKEKELFSEEPYSKEKGKKVFDGLYKNKLAHSIKINTNGVLEDVLVLEKDAVESDLRAVNFTKK